MQSLGYVTTANAAKQLGVSERRVRALIESGVLSAQKIGGRWLISHDSIDRWVSARPHHGRPLTPKNAWAFLLALSGDDSDCLSPWDKARLRHRLPNREFAHWLPRLRRRASPHRFQAHPGIIPKLTEDEKIVLTGVSAAKHYGADLVPRRELEGYVQAPELRRMVVKYHLSEGERPNVLLRAVDSLWPFPPGARIAPIGVVAVDLLESNDQRVQRAGRNLLRESLPHD